jgi:predicted DNA-binding ribbon-helix-helix protein
VNAGEKNSVKMQSLIIKRPIKIAGRKTSVSLEDAFWEALREIANRRGETLSKLVGSINTDRNFSNLSSAIRLFVVGYYRDQVIAKKRRSASLPAVNGRTCASSKPEGE